MRTSLDTLVPAAALVFGSMLILFQANPVQVMLGTVSAKMRGEGGATGIAWRDWSKEAFDEARDSGKLVLLDLSADWCHWCHVMDRTTYSDPDVIRAVNMDFVPVRVDIDARPDISERYNRGGFPTTAFLSDRGESVWGATYIPPKDMMRVITGILAAKASGEIAEALERSRMTSPDARRPTGVPERVDDRLMEALFEDIFETYDVEHGGFGLYPKFPHPDVLDLLLLRYLVTGDEEVAEAVRHTLARMTEGLFDRVEGGVFRYSVTRDWKEPHYEKMLETNAGFLRNLVGAYKVFRSREHKETASGVASYIVGRLRDPRSEGFYGSQDADEEYYKLPAEGRAKRDMPAVVKAIYAGWNSEAVSALVEAGAVLGNREWVDAAVGGWNYSLSRLWNEETGLVVHEENGGLYLFEDQVAFLDALLAVNSFTGNSDLLELGKKLISGIERHFQHADGGYADILRQEDAVGELVEGRRSLVANSRYARILALFSAAANDPQLADRSGRILAHFSGQELEAHGLFAAEYLIASHVLREGARAVTVALGEGADALSNDLWLAAKAVHNPAVVCSLDTGDVPGERRAVICTASACSEAVSTPEDLTRLLEVPRANKPEYL